MYLPGTTAHVVIVKLKSIFARWGIPLEFASDNGTQFDSRVIKDFALRWLTTVLYGFKRCIPQMCKFNLFFCINILITNKNPYMRQLLLQMTVWAVKGARNGKTVHD